MVGSETVLVVAVVDCYLDADTRIDQTDDCGRDTNVVRVSAVCGTCKSKYLELTKHLNGKAGQSALESFLPSNVSHQTSSLQCVSISSVFV